jgi:hypothetical protein
MIRKKSRNRSLAEAFSDSTTINRAVSTAVKQAVDMHRRAGNKVAVLRDGKVIKIDPRKISV